MTLEQLRAMEASAHAAGMRYLKSAEHALVKGDDAGRAAATNAAMVCGLAATLAKAAADTLEKSAPTPSQGD